jgi:cytochrome oxidase Cu insertion factor (SCO1/SenC/PrrC family)
MGSALHTPCGCALATLLSFALVGGPSLGLAAETPKYERKVEKYPMPDVTLVNQEGKRVRLLYTAS